MHEQRNPAEAANSPEFVAVRSIAWRDLCPWLLLFRCPRLALRVDVLTLATAGSVFPVTA